MLTDKQIKWIQAHDTPTQLHKSFIYLKRENRLNGSTWTEWAKVWTNKKRAKSSNMTLDLLHDVFD
jgi:hypothetical protein